MYGGGGGGQWPGQQQQQQTGYMQPQATGYMGMQQPQRPMMTGMGPQQTGYMGMQQGGMMPQATGMGMMPQQTGMGMGMGMGNIPGGPGFNGMRQPSYGQQPSPGMLGPGSAGGQHRFMSPQPMQMQPTGMMQSSTPRPSGMQPQMTGYPGTPMGMQQTGLMPQMTGMPMDPRMQLMSAQFLPSSTPFSGAPMAGNMNFNSAQMQPASFQSSIQNLSQQQQGSKEPKIPWALTKDERKSYDSIFRAWDQKGTGFLGGDVAIEVFGQSGLERDKLMQIWHLSDTENRGKLNQAEFHVAMGLIYRALNGNEIPEHLPTELIPPSAKDLSDSVDFLKDLLKRDANVRQTTALNLPETGSNSGANYGKTRSFHENPIQKQDATAYKHSDEKASTGYKSNARHLDRRTVRYGGESPADDLTEMKRQLAHTQRMLDSQASKDDDEDREVEREMEDLRFSIKRVQDDIDYYNRRGGRDAAENRRKAERDLMHLMHERLPLLEKRLEAKDKKKREERLDESRERDRRNEASQRCISRYGDYDDRSRESYGRRSDYGSDYSRSQTPTQRDNGRDTSSSARSPPPPPAPPVVNTTSKPAPVPPASPSVAAVSAPAPMPPNATASAGPPKNLSAEERQAWIRAEAQRRIAERMRALGASVPSASSPAPDNTVEQRLAADRAEAEQRAAKADADASAREEARRARIEEQRLEREKAAVTTVKAELKEQEKGENPPPALVIQAAREQVNEQEEMLRRREEVLKKEAEERQARFKRLEEEEAEAKRQEESFKQRQAQFQGGAKSPAASSSGLPAPVRKGKSGPPPPPPNRSRQAAATPAAPPAPPAPPVGETAQSPSQSPSTNPFHRIQQSNGLAAPTTPSSNGSTNPFFRQQGAQDSGSIPPSKFESNLPAPQRSVSAALPPPSQADAVQNVARSKAPDDDDDWGESEHGDQEDDDPDGPGSTSRATRQNLAAALFSGLVPTPPQSASPAPHQSSAAKAGEIPAAPAPPPAPPAPAAPDAPPVAPAAPAAPAAPTTVAPPTAGPPDRGALLGQIQGGLKLRKASTNDRSAAGLSGKVLGDASAPVQKYVPPPSPPPAAEADDSVDEVRNTNRQSVDWANSLASDQMHAHVKASAIPDEPSVREEEEDSEPEGPEDADATVLKATQNGSAPNAETDDFDMSKTIRVRTLYPYESQREEDLGFLENSVVIAHPAKDQSNDWWYGTLLTNGMGKKGTFPRAYVQSIEQPAKAKALYDFEGSSPEEMSFVSEQILDVVEHEDENWWKVIDQQDRILIIPATYVELVATHAGAPTEYGKDENVKLSEQEALALAIRESERVERERQVARSRDEKDLRIATQRSLEEGRGAVTTRVENEKANDDDDYDDDDSSAYSTTGWTSSEEETDDEEAVDQGLTKEELKEMERRRVTERLKVLEAAGILVVDKGVTQADQSDVGQDGSNEEVTAAEAEHLLLRRRTTSKRPKPERPERTIGEMRRQRQKPSRPDRPPPAPPAPPKEKQPEEQMDDAYDRFMKLKAEQKEGGTHSTIDADSSGAVKATSSSGGSSISGTVASVGTGLLSTIKSMSSRRTSGAMSPPAASERRSTPIISAPMTLRASTPSGGSGIGSGQVSPSLTGPHGETSSFIAGPNWRSTISVDVGDVPIEERKRQEAIFELIATEQTHVRDLQIIVDVFFNAMQPMLNAKAATVIFGNIEEVLLASVSLLSDLEARQRSAQYYITRIGDVLDRHMSLMSVYVPYCVNQETASHILTVERQRNAQLDGLLSSLRSEHPSARGLDLSHFLLTPMQRLTRYPLLIGQIIKYSPQDGDEEELGTNRKALATAQSLLDSTNEAIKQRQSEERLATLSEQINGMAKTGKASGNLKLDLTQPTRWMGPRKILREEVLSKQKSGRRITLILCNDIVLLMSSRSRQGGGAGGGAGPRLDQHLYRMPMPLEELAVQDVPAGLTGRDDLAFQLVHQGRDKINLRCASARACHSWMHSLESARSDCLAAANKLRSSSYKVSV